MHFAINIDPVPEHSRKLSLPPLDRARRCDSFASNENFGCRKPLQDCARMLCFGIAPIFCFGMSLAQQLASSPTWTTKAS